MELQLIAVVVTIFAMLAHRAAKTVITRGKTTILSEHLMKIMIIIVSVAVLTASLYVILSGRYDEGTQKWAFGTVGAIVGFWLKPSS